MPRRYSMDARSQTTAVTTSRVLDAAVDVLTDVGAQALTMQMVAERADVALRTVYNHYASKEAVIVAAYERLAGATQDAVRELPVTDSPRDDFLRFVDTWFDALEDQSPGAAAIMGVTGIKEYDLRVTEIRAWRRRGLTSLLKRAERSGVLRPPLKQAVAIAFLFTSYATWFSLAQESGLGPAGAKRAALRALDATLFAAPNPRQT